MIGLISTIEGREYRIVCPLILGLILDQEKFHMESGGCIHSLQKIKTGTEYLFTVEEFDQVSNLISVENTLSDVDVDFEKHLHRKESVSTMWLKEFRRLESILKEQGVL